ncbi:MAG: MarC family protein [Fimbriimonadaceae bacterium]
MSRTAIEFGVIAFSSLFAMVDPLASAPVFVSMTRKMPERRHQIAVRSCLAAGFALLLFALAGSKIFSFFGITVPAFQIVGGLLFTMTAIKELTGAAHHQDVADLESNDPSIVPIGIPLIAGAGSISTVMVLSGQARTAPWQIALATAILISIVITLITFMFAPKLVSKLGTTGQQVLSKVMALLSAVIGVQFIINGTTAVIVGLLAKH